MEVVCRGPFRARSFIWQPAPGAFSLTVICKTTFVLAEGESSFHVDPIDVLVTDTYYESDARSSLSAASDLAPVKMRAEILVAGHVHTPGGQPASEVVARVALGDVDKSILVTGDSHIALDNTFAGPLPFAKMPLRWERASAGDAGQNPVGLTMGRAARADAWGRVLLPNFRPKGARISSRWDVLPPAGFGPIAPDWPSRLMRLGRHASSLDPRRILQKPLPTDIDLAFFNAAPQDQTTEELLLHEPLILENLLPSAQRLTTRLGRISPRADLALEGGHHEPIELCCDTLTIDTDRQIATLLWRGQAPLGRPDRQGRVLVSGHALTAAISASVPAMFQPSREVSESDLGAEDAAHYPSSPAALTPRHTEALSVNQTIGITGSPSGFALPFDAPSRAPSSPELPPPESEEEPVFPETAHRTLAIDPSTARASSTGALPFQSAPGLDRPSSEYEPHRPSSVEADEPKSHEDPESAAETIRPPPPPAGEGSLERCARISALLARKPDRAHEVLAKESLSRSEWQALSAFWAAEIRKDIRSGRSERPAQFDAAFASALEAERGAFTPLEYARLIVAAERGEAESLITEMAIPAEALVRLRRVCVRKSASDPSFAAELSAALVVAQRL